MTTTTTSMDHRSDHRRVIVGVDTHKDAHVAVAIDGLGALLGSGSFTADRAGYRALIEWAIVFTGDVVFGVEGTGSYGAGLASAIRRSGIGVLEVLRTDRRDRRLRGKSDTVDAENAARAVLAVIVKAVPKTGDGIVEMIRVTKVAKDNAVKARTSAMISLKQVVINAPDELRQSLQGLPRMTLIHRCAGLRPGHLDDVTAATKNALRAIAGRWLSLDEEIGQHDHLLATLTHAIAPRLVEAFGIGPDVAAELLIVLGDNPETHPLRSRLRPPLRHQPDPRLLRHHDPPQTQPKRTPPSQRGPLPHRDRTHAAPRANHGLPRPPHQRRQTKPEIIRCLKRLLAREVWALTREFRHPETI